MVKKNIEFLVDTDVIEDHLIAKPINSSSYLELLMQKGICFSTVLNASDLLLKAFTELEQKIIVDVLSSMKILGLHARYRLLVPKYSTRVSNVSHALICVVADYNKLPIVTLKKSKYKNCELAVFHPSEIIL